MDLDADFDPDEHDRKMAALFDDGFYADGVRLRRASSFFLGWVSNTTCSNSTQTASRPGRTRMTTASIYPIWCARLSHT
jgi:hypothetical protein